MKYFKTVIILIFFLAGIITPAFSQLSEYRLKFLEDNNLLHLKDSLKHITDFRNGYAYIVDNNGKTNYIDKQGKKVYEKGEVVWFTQDYNTRFPKKYFVYVDIHKKQGIIDTAGNILLAANYDAVWTNEYGFILVRGNKTTAILNAECQQIATYAGTLSTFFNDSLVQAYNYTTEKSGVYNIRLRQFIIPVEYHQNIQSINWALCVNKDGYYGIFDLAGHCIIPCNNYYQILAEYDNKYLHCSNSKGLSILDSAGKEIIPPGLYDEIGYCYDGVFKVKKNGLWGAVNTQNELIIPIYYDELEGFKSGLTRANKGGQWFFLTKKNYRVGTNSHEMENGYRRYKNNDTLGYMDSSGQIFPMPQFKYVGDFVNEVAAVCNYQMKKGFINRELKLVIDTIYDDVAYSYPGYILVNQKNKFGVLNYKGEVIIPIVNEGVYQVGNYTYELENGAKRIKINLKEAKD